MTAQFDVLGIGNALVDVVASAEDGFLDEHGMAKGAMTLIDDDRAEAVYAAMGPGREISGGSGANTIAGLAALGGRAAYIGKVRDDQLGRIFAHDLKALGVGFETPLAQDGPPTGRCLILVTPDGQRTMNTFLGASTLLTPDDVDPGQVGTAAVTYLEGYLFDPPEAQAAFRKAAEAAHAAGRQVSLTLSDSFCVERHRAAFRELVAEHVDILFANEDEIVSLYEVADFDAALQAVRKECRIAALTRSEKGSVVLKGEEVHVVDADPVAKVVDTTGAGDLYAAGFLYGHTRHWEPAKCGRAGSIAAADAIAHFGARPETDLKKLLAAKL